MIGKSSGTSITKHWDTLVDSFQPSDRMNLLHVGYRGMLVCSTQNRYGFNVCVVLEIDGMQHTTYRGDPGIPQKASKHLMIGSVIPSCPQHQKVRRTRQWKKHITGDEQEILGFPNSGDICIARRTRQEQCMYSNIAYIILAGGFRCCDYVSVT